MISQAPLLSVTLWALFSLWVFFGSLELAEALQVVPEDAAEDQTHHDLDEDALIQLASGLKSDVARLGTPTCTSVSGKISDFAGFPSTRTARQLTRPMPQGPSSLRRHQELSVYRI